MIFVSNRTAKPIKVSITNKSGGDGNTFELQPKVPETDAANGWTRKATETATVTVDGKTVQFFVNPRNRVDVYDEEIVVSKPQEVLYLSYKAKVRHASSGCLAWLLRVIMVFSVLKLFAKWWR